MTPPRPRDTTTRRRRSRRGRPKTQEGQPRSEQQSSPSPDDRPRGELRSRRRRRSGRGSQGGQPRHAQSGQPRGGGSGGGGQHSRPRGNGRSQTRPRGQHPPYIELLREIQQRVTIDPFERLKLETRPDGYSMRVLDLVAPIGKGQRCLIVSPPKAGKTTLLIDVARSIEQNHPEVTVMALLVDERPEEVTGFRRGVKAEVFAASSDLTANEHIEVAERCLGKALELVVEGKDVVILLDSITRLARGYNTVAEGVGRTLSGGLDAATMHTPRQFFGAARKIEDGGSLTILGTALIDTGSRMDQVIFEEFKGTGNTELVLSRELFEKRIFPCVDIAKSGTRKEEKLYPAEQVAQIHMMRRALARLDRVTAMVKLLEFMSRYRTNDEVLGAVGAALS